ncbi:MAG: glycine cleavage system aminomethyltransferase GcvT [Bacteroidaceae bacterium]|nr:glycine cleavage system aminomethyltransferase GcvT [Bacteroidaceae bacterium]
MDENKKTCLYQKHVALGAQMSPFGGFIMPIQYSGIREEHLAVRHHCGVFDVSHMGEVEISGPDAQRYVQHIFTNDVAQAPAGKILYGMMLYPTGGTVDDLLVYCEGDNRYFLVINASNIEKDVEWMKSQMAGFNIKLDHQSENYGELAIQGPEAESVMEEVLGLSCKELEFYTFKSICIDNESLIISRTGYTGEDGFEIYGSPHYINQAWDALMKSGRALPCGLGCRDTLRFEVGLPLYGDELSADVSPIEAGLSIFVKTDKEDFIGREAIINQKANGVTKKLVGLALAEDDKAIPRHGYEVEAEGKKIGYVTTGYRTIMTDKSVCFALIDAAYKDLGTKVQISIHRKLHEATVVKRKFYEKNYKK